MSVKLLIADDEEVIRRGVAKYIRLHTDRFDKIYEAENGEQAIELMLQYQPDMLLLDVQMPLKNGIDVMKEAVRAGLNPITVILSGYDEFKYAQQALNYGAKAYLLKPTRGADILACLNKLADEHLEKKETNPVSDLAQPNHLIRRAEEYIAEHYMENITLNGLAEVIGISSGYLSTLFPQTLHCNFVDYLNKVRIERACCYLEQSYFKTYEIAYRVGFNDEKYFSKVFKKVKGMTPKEYRNAEKREKMVSEK